MDLVSLASDQLHCTISQLGAELLSLTSRADVEYLWNGDPAWWNGRAPILFPVVGMLAGGEYRWEGKRYPLEKHGFARRNRFTLIDHDGASATLRCAADEGTRRVYPFEFTLDLNYALGDDLVIAATVANLGSGPMPFSFGFHPAFRIPAGEVVLTFSHLEQGPVWRLNEAGLLDRTEPLPVHGRTLIPTDEMFRADAMILRDIASHAMAIGASDRSLRLEWDNLPDLGLWTKPGAPFLCIEPWAGFNDPAGFAGSIEDKPGIVMLAPGSSWTARLRICPDAA